MKCVAQMPQPVAAPAVVVQITRARPCVAIARCITLTAVQLARKQMRPASATRRGSCSPESHVRTRTIGSPWEVRRKNYRLNLSLVLRRAVSELLKRNGTSDVAEPAEPARVRHRAAGLTLLQPCGRAAPGSGATAARIGKIPA